MLKCFYNLFFSLCKYIDTKNTDEKIYDLLFCKWM